MPRGWRHVTAHAAMAGELAHAAEGGAKRPLNPSYHAAAARLTAEARGDGRQGTDPGNSPHELSAATHQAYANGTILPARPIVEAEEDHGQGRLCTQANQWRSR